MGAADALRRPALALLDDHGVEAGPGQGAGGEGAAGAGADDDRVAAGVARPLCRAPIRFIAGSGREGSWREPTAAISLAKASVPWASSTIDLKASSAGVPPSRASCPSQRLASIGGAAPSVRPVRARESASTPTSAAPRPTCEIAGMRETIRRRRRRRARDRAPRPRAAGALPPRLPARTWQQILGPAGGVEDHAVREPIGMGEHVVCHLGAARDPEPVLTSGGRNSIEQPVELSSPSQASMKGCRTIAR